MGVTASSPSSLDVSTELVAAGDGDALDEVILGDFPETFVYKLPPRSRAEGYCADAWGLDKPAATGRLRVTAWDSVVCLVIWRRAETAAASSAPAVLPAVARRTPLTAAPASSGWLVIAHARWDVLRGSPLSFYLESVLDSSRYFVLRCQPPPVRQQGPSASAGTASANSAAQVAHALVGIGFRERESAFTLKAAIADHTRSCERQAKGAGNTPDASTQPTPRSVSSLHGTGGGEIRENLAAQPSSPPASRVAIAGAPSDTIRMLRPPPPPSSLRTVDAGVHNSEKDDEFGDFNVAP